MYLYWTLAVLRFTSKFLKYTHWNTSEKYYITIAKLDNKYQAQDDATFVETASIILAVVEAHYTSIINSYLDLTLVIQYTIYTLSWQDDDTINKFLCGFQQTIKEASARSNQSHQYLIHMKNIIRSTTIAAIFA